MSGNRSCHLTALGSRTRQSWIESCQNSNPRSVAFMKQEQFKIIDPLADSVDEAAQKWFTSEEMKPLLEQIRLATQNAPDVILGLSVQLLVSSEDRKGTLRLLTTGMQASDGEPAYLCHGDSSIGRYICDGEICELPHDQCPNCWGDWDFKEKHRTCGDCGYQLGDQVKFLLDSDRCPFCELGTVSVGSPSCSRCEKTVDLTIVTWG